MRRAPALKAPDDLHDDLARLEASVVDGMILNADKLTRMLRTTEEVLEAAAAAGQTTCMTSSSCTRRRNVATCSGVVYRSALDRTESREQFFREDFPMTDPAWFCWHGATLSRDGNVVFDRQAFPTEGVRFTPDTPEAVALGPIGAIIRGEHEALVQP